MYRSHKSTFKEWLYYGLIKRSRPGSLTANQCVPFSGGAPISYPVEEMGALIVSRNLTLKQTVTKHNVSISKDNRTPLLRRNSRFLTSRKSLYSH